MPAVSKTSSKASSIVPGHALHGAWWGAVLKVLLAAAAIAALAGVWFAWIEPHEAGFERWMGSLGGWAPAIFIATVAAATTCFLPKSLFSMAAGAIFGPWWGLLWMLAAATIAASLAFLLVGRCWREPIRRRLQRHPRLGAVDAAVAERGARLVLLLRMTPISFAAMNLALSASGVSFRAYAIGLLGLVPGTVSAVAVGVAARHTADLAARATSGEAGLAPGDSMVREVGLYAGVAASVLVTVMVTRIAVRAVREATDAA